MTKRAGMLVNSVLLSLVLLILLPAIAGGETTEAPYERVIIFGIDGAGDMIQKVDTPQFDRIFAAGSITHECRATVPTVSAQGWGAMFYGVPGTVHGVSNEYVEYFHKNNELYPSFFLLAKEAYPKSRVAAFASWHAITWGLIEWKRGIDIYPTNSADLTMKELNRRLTAYLNKFKPKVLFICNNDVDEALHKHGYGSPEYIATLQQADSEMGETYDLLAQKGLLKNALVLFTTDHGGNGTSHGGATEQEIRCTFAAVGKDTELHGTIGEMELQDVAAVVLYALGIEQPEVQTGRVPAGIFPGIGGTERKADPFPTLLETYGNRAPVAWIREPGVSEELKEKMVYYQNFEGETSILSGRQETVPGLFGNALDMWGTYVKTGVKDLTKWKGLSIGFWLRDKGEEKGDPILVTDKDWSKAKHKGFAIAKSGDQIQINIGNGKDHKKSIYWMLPQGYKGKWIHYLVVFDQKEQTVRLYCDFAKAGEARILPKAHSGWTTGKEIVAGQDITGGYKYTMNAEMDELMIFDQALTEEEMHELKEWYDLCLKNSDNG